MAEGLDRWAQADLGGEALGPLVRPNDGLSSETYLAGSRYVVRLAPAEGLFPVYDLALQARLQSELPAFGIPTAPVVAYVGDPQWVGRPFLVMERVSGHVLSDNPPFTREGWLHDGSPALQQTVSANFMDVLADVHRLPSFAGLTYEGLAGEVDRWDAYLTWATDADRPADLDAALEWCRAHLPDPEPPPSLLWGDVRFGNVIFDDDGGCAAVLDWEMAACGPAEIDLGWFFALREMMAPPGGVELPGFLDRAAALARYEARLGRAIDELWWYELFALIRSTAILIRTQRLLVQQGQGGHWLVGFDPVPRRLTKFVRA